MRIFWQTLYKHGSTQGLEGLWSSLTWLSNFFFRLCRGYQWTSHRQPATPLADCWATSLPACHNHYLCLPALRPAACNAAVCLQCGCLPTKTQCSVIVFVIIFITVFLIVYVIIFVTVLIMVFVFIFIIIIIHHLFSYFSLYT
jgi:hypothetical protein